MSVGGWPCTLSVFKRCLIGQGVWKHALMGALVHYGKQQQADWQALQRQLARESFERFFNTYLHFNTEDGCSWPDQAAAWNRAYCRVLLWLLCSENPINHLPRSYFSLKETLSFKWKKEKRVKWRERSQDEAVLSVAGEPSTSCFSRCGHVLDCARHRLLQLHILQQLCGYIGNTELALTCFTTFWMHSPFKTLTGSLAAASQTWATKKKKAESSQIMIVIHARRGQGTCWLPHLVRGSSHQRPGDVPLARALCACGPHRRRPITLYNETFAGEFRRTRGGPAFPTSNHFVRTSLEWLLNAALQTSPSYGPDGFVTLMQSYPLSGSHQGEQ